MVQTFLDVLLMVGVIIAMLIPGYLIRRTGMIKRKLVDNQFVNGLSVILLYVAQPFLTMRAFVFSDGVTPTWQVTVNMVLVLVFTIVAHLLGFVICRMVFVNNSKKSKQVELSSVDSESSECLLTAVLASQRTLDSVKSDNSEVNTNVFDSIDDGSKRLDENRVYTLASIFGSAGFLGVPLVDLFVSSPYATLYSIIVVVGFNIVLWTLGIYIMTGQKKYISIKKAFINPAVFPIFVAIPMFYIPELNIFTLPTANGAMGSIVDVFATMALPLAMTIVGIRLADMPLRQIVSYKSVYISSIIRLLLIPAGLLGLGILASAVGLFNLTDPNNYIILAVVIVMCVPSAFTLPGMLEKYGYDSELTIKVILMSTFLSILSVPIVIVALTEILTIMA